MLLHQRLTLKNAYVFHIIMIINVQIHKIILINDWLLILFFQVS